jgi:protein tyrosine/serine phosphatase
MKNTMFCGWGLGLAVFLSGCGGVDRLTEMDAAPNGYVMYRSAQPNAEDAEEICKRGVRKVFALNGEGRKYAERLKEVCPNAEIVYDYPQSPDDGVPSEFLDLFDRSVEEAKAAGQGILFHCSCGCHRTGRLAAYYRMKYQNWSAAAAIDEMNTLGKDISQHPSLNSQIYALEDAIQGRGCSQPVQFCIGTR